MGGDDDSGLVEAWNPDRSVPAVIAAFLGKDVGLPRRWLPHARLSHLYWMFRAGFDVPVSEEAESKCSGVLRVPGVADACPSWGTFHSVWQSTWKKYLMCRTTSQHAECKTCFEARQLIQARGSSLVDRWHYARQWQDHLRDQYHDRAIYWFCRYASRHRMDVLTIIIDSMDKAKFAWPQYPWHRVDKQLEHLRRPRLIFTAAIAHGYGTFFYIADEHLSHGASAFCDVLDRVIEAVWVMSRRSGVPLPAHLVVQSDNTTAQAKNSVVNIFLSYLVARYKFQTTSLFYLVVGHTHEDIDQLFGLVLQLVLRKVNFETPVQLMHALVRLLREKIEGKGECLFVEDLTHIRDFALWLRPLRIELYGAFGTRHGIEAPHAFTYKVRRDLTKAERNMIPNSARGFHGDEADVFACVKTYMHSTALQQPPLMVLPLDRLRAAHDVGPVPEFLVPGAESPERAKELRELAVLLRGAVYNMPLAADALALLADGPPGPPQLPPTPWLAEECDNRFSRLIASQNELFPHLPDTSWHLLVRFKQQR